MKHRALLIPLFLACRSFSLGAVAAIPRLHGASPAPIVPVAPALGAVLPAPPSAPLPLLPMLSPSALDAARALNGALSAAEAEGREPTPALSAVFDGAVAAAPGESASFAAPDAFVLEARRRFAELRRSEGGGGARAAGAIPSEEEMRGRMDRLPATNSERMRFMIELFKLAGAKDADIVLQDAGYGRSNVIVTKKGRTERVIVVGAHYDKASEGLGKIDNGTGATMVANLYQALNGVQTDATIVFVAFAREEEGLYGSQAYVDSLDQAARGRNDAMINLDTLAVNGTFSWKNNSTRALLDRLARVSRDSGHELKEDVLEGGDADSSTFRDAGIPAVTIYGASQDVIFDIIHSERDTMAAFSLAHYRNAYLLVLEAIKSLDRVPLGSVARGDI
ncbi:MAG: M28 family peptidase [Elusimicrobia bacterium]|nr:M28 family peptidase [Elusimicrobiota bacterium]